MSRLLPVITDDGGCSLLIKSKTYIFTSALFTGRRVYMNIALSHKVFSTSHYPQIRTCAGVVFLQVYELVKVQIWRTAT